MSRGGLLIDFHLQMYQHNTVQRFKEWVGGFDGLMVCSVRLGVTSKSD